MRYSVGDKADQQNGVVDSDGRIVWLSSRSPRVRFPLTSLRRVHRDATTEVTRPDEDTVLKTAAVKTVVGSSPTASACLRNSWERFHTGGCNPSAFNCVVAGERCDSLRSHFCKHTHVSGVTVALLIPNQLVRVQILGDVLSGSTENSPVVQRLRHLFYTQETMVRFHPGLLRPSE